MVFLFEIPAINEEPRSKLRGMRSLSDSRFILTHFPPTFIINYGFLQYIFYWKELGFIVTSDSKAIYAVTGDTP